MRLMKRQRRRCVRTATAFPNLMCISQFVAKLNLAAGLQIIYNSFGAFVTCKSGEGSGQVINLRIRVMNTFQSILF